MAGVLRGRGVDVIIQTEFFPDWRTVPQMLQQQLGQSDAVIALIGPAHGGGPDFEPARLNDKRTHGRMFSFTQWEYLVARDLKRPIFTFILSGDELIDPFPEETAELRERQRRFIIEFPKDRSALYYEYFERQKLFDHLRAIEFETTVLAGRPMNLPYTSLGTLFKGRAEFLARLRQHVTAKGPVVIKGKRAIHGMGGVGKTRVAIEYAWKYADAYRALLFISADTLEAFRRNLAALCGPLILNLPEQDEKEQAIQVEAVIRWLRIHPDWFLIIDNVDTVAAAEETKALIGKLTSGHVLITSRISDWTGHVRSLDLDVLTEAAAIAFLNERTKERRPKKKDDREKVASLVRLLGCLALALEQAGAHISASVLSYADYIVLWKSHRADVLSWHDKRQMKYPKSLAITYETSVAQLSDGAKRLFNMLAWFAPDPIPRSLLDPLPNSEYERRYLGEIERLHLAKYIADGTAFTVHRLNQQIAKQAQRSVHPPALISSLEWLNSIMPDDTFDIRTWPAVRPILPHAIAIGHSGVQSEIPRPSNRLLSQSGTFLMSLGELSLAENQFRAALNVTERYMGTQDPLVATYLSSLALVLMETDRKGEARTCLDRAIAINDATLPPNHVDVARDLNNLAMLHFWNKEFDKAEPLLKRVISIHENADTTATPRDYGSALNNFARLLHSTGRLDEAANVMKRSLEFDEDRLGKSDPLIAIRLNNLAMITFDQGHPEDAISFSRRAVKIDINALGPDHPRIALHMATLARFLKAANQDTEAERCLRRHLEILIRFSIRNGHRHRALDRGIASYHTLLVETRSRELADEMIDKMLAGTGFERP